MNLGLSLVAWGLVADFLSATAGVTCALFLRASVLARSPELRFWRSLLSLSYFGEPAIELGSSTSLMGSTAELGYV